MELKGKRILTLNRKDSNDSFEFTGDRYMNTFCKAYPELSIVE